MKQSLQKEFANPGSMFRGKPFWGWNSRLEPAELRRQIRGMHEMGLGGFFMHSRLGLETEYLSDDWFDCVKVSVDEAKKLGMEAWLYDEDRWPSGAAGGLATRDEKCRARSLRMDLYASATKLKWKRDVVAAFTAKVEGVNARELTRIPRGTKLSRLSKGTSLLTFSVEVAEGQTTHNGFPYLDTLNHVAVKKFIDLTHEAYKKHIGDEFGKLIPGMFTDEPQHSPRLAGPPAKEREYSRSQPWTGSLPAVFKERYGYDIIPHLPKLFFDLDGEPLNQPRFHFHDCVTHLFTDAFSRQIGEWCEEHGILFTGHVMMEDSLQDQSWVVGSCMRFYEHMQAPGMDLLSEHDRVYDTAKQVSSAARQFDRKWRLTETYGCTGWDFPFAGHKALGDWQLALGINLRCQHHAWYDMKGQSKRDYPASLNFHSPWWDAYAKVEDYFSRIHAVMTRGKEVRDVLVIQPLESVWSSIKIGWTRDKSLRQLNHSMAQLRDCLLGANIDFDYGDEEILSRHGLVKGGRFHVAKASYTTIILPPMLTLRRTTLALLRDFQKAGGAVVFIGEPPRYVDALASDEVVAFSTEVKRVAHPGARLLKEIGESGRRLSIRDKQGAEVGATLHLLRQDRDAAYLFLCNTGRDITTASKSPEVKALKRQLSFPAIEVEGLHEFEGAPLELDPTTGEITTARAERTQAGWKISTSLPKLGSRLFVIPRKASTTKPRGAVVSQPPSVTHRRPISPARWDIRISEANNLLLDRAHYRLGKGSAKSPWKGREDILRIDDLIRKKLGVETRTWRMIQPWALPTPHQQKAIPFQLKYHFQVEKVPTGGMLLAMEGLEGFRITLNGRALNSSTVNGWWVDPTMQTLPLDTTFVQLGENQLLIEGEYPEKHAGLENIYLLGSFGVRLKGEAATIIDPPTSLKPGDWCSQGLPFYSGNLSYVKSIPITDIMMAHKKGRVLLRVPDYRGAAVRILINGTEVGVIAWEPHELEITEFLQGKRVGEKLELTIQILGHRRNSHGPHHYKERFPHWTGPEEFHPSDDDYVPTYQLVPCGLMKGIEIVTMA
jgi:hypothetical protein